MRAPQFTDYALSLVWSVAAIGDHCSWWFIVGVVAFILLCVPTLRNWFEERFN